MGISRYPRPGQRIAPLALREILNAPLPDHLLGHSRPAHMHKLSDLDETAWSHFGPEVCRQLGEAVVSGVRGQLNSAPRSLRTRRLPRLLDGVELEELELEQRTYNALKREQPWLAFAKRIEQVAGLRGIGARALVDLLTSIEATIGPAPDDHPQPVRTVSAALDERRQSVQTACAGKGPQTITFHITENNLNEGGRRRRGEAYLNMDRVKAALFGVRDIAVVTDDGLEFPARLSGNSGRRGSQTPKNLRSRPARMLGFWLVERHKARPGDQVHVKRLDNDRFLFRFVRSPIGAPSQPPLDARIARELASILTHLSAAVLLNATLVREIRPLRDIPGAEAINESDPRLGYLLREVGLGAATVKELGDGLGERSHALPGPEVAVRLRHLREAAQAKERMELEEELRDLVASVVSHSDRNHLIVTRYLGWDGRGGTTLQSVGDEFGMSRERVRQICAPVAKALAATKPFAPALDRVLSVVAEKIPAPASAIEKALVAEGLTAAPFSLEGLIKSAETIPFQSPTGTTLKMRPMILGRQLPFVVTGSTGGRMVLSPQTLAVGNRIVRCARKSVEHWGVTTIEDITAQVMEQLPEPVRSDFVTQILRGHQDFQWLDEAGGWFWLTSVSRNRLLNRINKVLSVGSRVNVVELRSGVAREYRMQGFVPPQRVLLELCRQAAGYLVEGSTVSADPPVAWGEALNETEQILLLALETHGPVMRREELEELCVELGMKRSTFYVRLGYSPFIARYAPGVYGLRGADVEPGLVESLISPRRRGRVLKDYGWTTDGMVWLGYQLSQAMISGGAFTVPAAMKSFVSGEFLLKAEDGSPIGAAVIQESWSWGLGPFFRRRGGEPGDHLILVFDLAAREAVVHIGDADLLDQFQALDEDGS